MPTHLQHGLHEYRFRQNPQEQRFAEAWTEFNKHTRHIDYLLRVGDQTGRPPHCSERDEVVAATIVQWLGSPVGLAFLRDLGFTKDPGLVRGAR